MSYSKRYLFFILFFLHLWSHVLTRELSEVPPEEDHLPLSRSHNIHTTKTDHHPLSMKDSTNIQINDHPMQRIPLWRESPKYPSPYPLPPLEMEQDPYPDSFEDGHKPSPSEIDSKSFKHFKSNNLLP
ncbi:hypothetical protein PIB30_057728 [Stylosanthes scabra]|uniref:Uncharacterized protein n=1 Tax=Stylosanthes scabra TaxID=79078 RepID=A0ABU6SJP6_9FABA|nr:hypothetical protein [Stylosanthes scabra]